MISLQEIIENCLELWNMVEVNELGLLHRSVCMITEILVTRFMSFVAISTDMTLTVNVLQTENERSSGSNQAISLEM